MDRETKLDILWKVVMWGLVALVLCLVSFQACDHIYQKAGIPSDNVLEEAFEDILEKETGVKIDITPNSPESKE